MARRLLTLVNTALAAVTLFVLVMSFAPTGAGAEKPTTTTTAASSTSSAPATTSPVTPPPTTAPRSPTTRPRSATTVPPTSSITKPPATVSPVVTSPYYRTVPYTVLPTTTVSTTSTTSTTIAAIGGHLPVSPSTLPLTTRGSSAHVDPIFAMLSGVGFFVALMIVAGRLVITRPRRAG